MFEGHLRAREIVVSRNRGNCVVDNVDGGACRLLECVQVQALPVAPEAELFFCLYVKLSLSQMTVCKLLEFNRRVS